MTTTSSLKAFVLVLIASGLPASRAICDDTPPSAPSIPLPTSTASVDPVLVPLPPIPPAPPMPAVPPLLGLTVSGGVSLGSFEAGYLYYLFEALKLNPGLADPRIFTGASAGSVNALLEVPEHRIGFRGGFAFSTGNHFLADACKNDDGCSRARADTYLALVLYQLVRLQLGFAAYPPMLGLDWDYAIQPRVGVELDRP